MVQQTYNLPSPAKTTELGKKIGSCLKGGEIIGLIGDLGVGKTLLVRGIASGAGIAPDMVSSPTFTLIQEYPGDIRLVHVDLYRFQHHSEISSIGLYEYFDPGNAVLIEWADRAGALLPTDRLMLTLQHAGSHRRIATLKPGGEKSLFLFNRIIHKLLPS